MNPPNYDLSNITVSVALFYANNDWLISTKVSNGKVGIYLNNRNVYSKESLVYKSNFKLLNWKGN